MLGLIKLILINMVPSGDNAIVIALACRNLPAVQQQKAIWWGSLGAIGLRLILTFAKKAAQPIVFGELLLFVDKKV
jgi:predicted tellurium resistance membrane protein TerC